MARSEGGFSLGAMMRTLAEPLQPVFGSRDPYGFSPTERSQGSTGQELAPRPKSKSTGSRWRLRTAEPEPPSTEAPLEPPPLPAPADDFEDFPAIEAKEPSAAGVAQGAGTRFLTEEDRVVEEPEFRYEEAIPEEGSAPEPAQMQPSRRSSLRWRETPQPQPAISKEPEEREKPPDPDFDVGAPEIRSPALVPQPPAGTSAGSPSVNQSAGSPSVNQTFKTGKVLKSLYERQQEEAKRRHRREVQAHAVEDDTNDNDDEENYQDEMRNAQFHMRSAVAAERKALAAQSNSRLGWLGERLDATFKDLTRATKNDASAPATNAPGSSPRDDEKKEETTERAKTGEEAIDAEAETEEAPQEEEEEDYESDDEIAMNTRYASRCSISVIAGINKEMEKRGQALPEEDAEEVKRQEERMKKGKARKPTTFEKAMKEEVSTYQDIMRERLQKLGSDAGAASMKTTVDPAEAVKDAVLKYHQTCQKVGKMYAFEKPTGAAGLDMTERRQITRFVRDLKDEDPDRYVVKS